MAKCTRCRQRKAKRFCPALAQQICPLCCGVLRQKKIHCPSDCVFLSKHQSYQDKRRLEKERMPALRPHPADKDPLRDERLAWLAFHIEVPLRQSMDRDPGFGDKEALFALKYARNRIEEESRIVVFADS